MRLSRILACFAVSMLLAAASAAQLRQVAIVEIPGRPGFDAVAFSGKFLLIAHTAANTLDVFDPARRRVVAQVKDLNAPRGLAVDAEQQRLYVANAGNNTISVVSSGDWKILDTIQLSAEPDALLLVPQRDALYVSLPRHQALASIDLKSRQAREIPLNTNPARLSFDRKRNLVYVSAHGGAAEIIALDAGNAVAHRFRLNATQPTGMALDAEADHLYVAVRAAVLAIDPTSGTEIARVPSSSGTDTLWYDENTRSIFAASEDGAVNMIRADAGRYYSEDEFKTQVKGHTLAFDASRQFVYMPGGREGRSKLVIVKRVENPNSQSAAVVTPPATPAPQGSN